MKSLPQKNSFWKIRDFVIFFSFLFPDLLFFFQLFMEMIFIISFIWLNHCNVAAFSLTLGYDETCKIIYISEEGHRGVISPSSS